MSTLGHRLVPIRPSPQRGVSCQKGVTMIKSSPQSPTSPQTGLKRKYEEDDEDSESETESCKRRINFSMNYDGSPLPVSISRRNARERNRVKQVNNGFAALRQHIPGAAKAKKISKVDTLKQAVEYIQNLQILLEENDKALNESQEYLLPQMSGNAGSSRSLTNINERQSQQNKECFMKPAFFYNENVSPNTTSSSPNIMPFNLSRTSIASISPGDEYSDQNTSDDNYALMDLGNRSNECLMTSLVNILCATPLSSISQNTTRNQVDIGKNYISSNQHKKFNAIDILSNQSFPPCSPPELSQEMSFSVSNENLDTVSPPYQQHTTTTVALSPSLQGNTQLITNSINVPVMSAQVYTGSSNHPIPHQSLIVEPPDQINTETKHLHALTPAELDCLPYDLLNSKLPEIESSYTDTIESHIDANEGGSPFKSPTESSYDTSTTDSSYGTITSFKSSPPPSITNIDSVLSSNLMPSLTNLIDVYDSIPQTSSDVQDDLLDAIDLWEKC